MTANTQNGTNHQQELSRKERLLLNNPTELASVVRNQTLIVQNGLSSAGVGSDENQPLKVYSSFSRFIFAIINADKKSVTSNIRVTDIPGIVCASDYAFQMHMDAMYQPKISEKREGGVDTSSLPFTRRFASGNMKGKTPVEVIMNAEDREAAINQLKSQYKWLRDNAKKNARYAEGNKEQMDAIEQAVNLYREGKLTEDAVNSAAGASTGKIIPLYYSGFRPLRSREKKNNKTFIYEVKLDWNIGADYPVTVEIKNYYALVTEQENGTLNVQVKTKENEQKNTMALSAPEWQNILYMIKANLQMFEHKNANYCYSGAIRAQRRSREAAGLDQNFNN